MYRTKQFWTSKWKVFFIKKFSNDEVYQKKHDDDRSKKTVHKKFFNKTKPQGWIMRVLIRILMNLNER